MINTQASLFTISPFMDILELEIQTFQRILTHLFIVFKLLRSLKSRMIVAGVTLRVATGQQLQGYSVQLVQHQGSVKGNDMV